MPFLNYKKHLISKKYPYALFNIVDGMDLKDKWFTYNESNLVASLEQTDPLVIKFRNERSYIRYAPASQASTKVIAEISDAEDLTIIALTVKSNPVYMVWAVLTVILFLSSILITGYNTKTLPYLGIFIFSLAFDLYAKKNILKRVEVIFSNIQ